MIPAAIVHHDGALGDVLLSLPCIRLIGTGVGVLHFAGRGDVGALLRGSGLVAAASSTAEGRYARLQGGAMHDADRSFLARFRRAFVFTVAPDSALVRSFQLVLSDTQVVLTAPPADGGVSVAAFRAAQLGGTGESSFAPLLPVPSHHRELAEAMLVRAGYDGVRPLLAVHPGSGGRSKNWPLERFFAVLDRCRERSDAFILLFSGPAEDGGTQDRMETFARKREGIAHFAGADLSTVAALLQSSDRYLGNDSGVSHLAAAVGCRALVLYGPTDPVRWRPAGAPVETLRSADLAEIAIDAVAGKLLRGLCRP